MRHGPKDNDSKDHECEVKKQGLTAYSCGFSCCPYSKLNSKAASNRTAIRSYPAGGCVESEGVDTAVGNVEFISQSRPCFSIMENVKELDDPSGTGGATPRS